MRLSQFYKIKLWAQYSFTYQTRYIAKKYMQYILFFLKDLGNTVASDKTKIMTNWFSNLVVNKNHISVIIKKQAHFTN